MPLNTAVSQLQQGIMAAKPVMKQQIKQAMNDMRERTVYDNSEEIAEKLSQAICSEMSERVGNAVYNFCVQGLVLVTAGPGAGSTGIIK